MVYWILGIEWLKEFARVFFRLVNLILFCQGLRTITFGCCDFPNNRNKGNMAKTYVNFLIILKLSNSTKKEKAKKINK